MAEMTRCILLNAELENDYAHTYWFEDKAAQTNYFMSKKFKEYGDFSYVRKDGIISVPEHVDTLRASGANYVMYQNQVSFPGKWFYAFITKMEYSNPQVTKVYIETDVMQTWLFDMEVNPCFIEREHVISDRIGDHTIPEGLEMGEYVVNKITTAGYSGYAYKDESTGEMVTAGPYIVVGVSQTPDKKQASGGFYDGIYSGIKYYAFTKSEAEDVPGTGNVLKQFISNYDTAAAGAGIICMFMAPASLIQRREDRSLAENRFANVASINEPGTTAVPGEFINIAISTNKLDDYTPKNKKLMTYPYRYMAATNNAGGTVVYHYEKFYKTEEQPSGEQYKTIISPCFDISGVVTPGCSVRLNPRYYNGVSDNYSEGLTMGKFPILNWTSDIYTNWLTQNGVNIALDLLTGTGQMALGVAAVVGTGGTGAALGAGSIVGGASKITNTLTQTYQASLVPAQSKGNLNSGDVTTSMGANDFFFYDMSIKKEYARIIDEYFSMYGYKCNRVKTPESNHRASYWYTKTIEANITGKIPQEDLQIIKNNYDRGITFWKNVNSFRNYGVNNSIV